MTEDIPGVELVKHKHSDNVRLNAMPYVVFNTDCASYINKKAATLLNASHGDLLALFSAVNDPSMWFLAKQEELGMLIIKRAGLHTFCDLNAVRALFKALKINSTRAYFRLKDQPEIVENHRMVQIIPKPFNIK